MTLILVWNFIQRFWISIAVAGAFAFVMAWHFNAVRIAVKKNDVEWAAKYSANAAAWIARVREADDATQAKEVAFTSAVTTINSNRMKENNDAKISLATALARPRLRDPYPAERAYASKIETGAVAGLRNETPGSELSIEASTFLRTEAARADEIVRESNDVKALLVETYKACSN